MILISASENNVKTLFSFRALAILGTLPNPEPDNLFRCNAALGREARPCKGNSQALSIP